MINNVIKAKKYNYTCSKLQEGTDVNLKISSDMQHLQWIKKGLFSGLVIKKFPFKEV